MYGKGFWAVAAACLALTAILISGCGSSDSSGTATAENTDSAPLTKKQFVAQANQICQKGLEEKDAAVVKAREELPAQVVKNPTPQSLAIFVEQTVIPAYQELIDQLNQLDVPKGEEAAVEKIVTKYEAGLKNAEAKPGKAVTKNPFEAADIAAEAYGLEMCRL